MSASSFIFKPRWRLFCGILLWLIGAIFAHAKEAQPLAADEAVEQRLLDISSELRCLVCQNESLAASQAELAHDLRREIRHLIKENKSDTEITAFLVDRYGDFVRYRPPLKGSTWLLWFGPGLFLIGGLALLARHLRRRDQALLKAHSKNSLSAAEIRQTEQFLHDDPAK